MLTSTPRQGSTFTVRLYLPSIAVTCPPRPVGHAARRLLPSSRRTLLVVDDQPLQRQLLAGLLVPWFCVLSAAGVNA